MIDRVAGILILFLMLSRQKLPTLTYAVKAAIRA